MKSIEKPITREFGREFEEDVFGYPVVEVPFENRRYTRDEALKLAGDFQLGEPLTELGRKLRDAVAKELKDDVLENVELISTLGSLIDTAFGIDGFIKYDDVIVTLDTSLRDKHGEQKADIIIHPGELESPRALGIIADTIAFMIRSRTRK